MTKYGLLLEGREMQMLMFWLDQRKISVANKAKATDTSGEAFNGEVNAIEAFQKKIVSLNEDIAKEGSGIKVQVRRV